MTPELFTGPWFSALAAIILIDLVLAGDNALVIGLAARNVPAEMQKRVVLWGTVGAIVVRTILTGVVVYLLRIPGFLFVGGIALVYIAWKLTKDGGAEGHGIEAKASVRAAVQTIIIADTVMGVDNVLAVGGAAAGSFLLVVIGLAVSVPIMVWGSTLVLKWVGRFPAIMWIGAAVLGWTAAKMITSEELIEPWFEAHAWARSLVYLVIIGGLVAVPIWRSLSHRWRAQASVLIVMALWLTIFGEIEERLHVHINIFDHWRWDDELIDLVRWIGWIPVALWVHRWLEARASAAQIDEIHHST